MMVGINHWSRLGIGNISRSQSEQTLRSADHAADGASDYRTDRTCGLAANRSAVLDAVWNALCVRRERNCEDADHARNHHL